MHYTGHLDEYGTLYKLLYIDTNRIRRLYADSSVYSGSSIVFGQELL